MMPSGDSRPGNGRYGPEREELEAVLRSGLLDRAPLLSSFLRYVCEKAFRGEAGEIKEYSIAVEALGRPPDFDHTRDSIVRVEAHRLRKRLKAYYESRGAAHQLEITIPVGGYVPVFVSRTPEQAAPAEEVLPARRAFAPMALMLALLALLTIAALWLTDGRENRLSAVADSEGAVPPAVRLLAGRPNGLFVDPFGQVWQRDSFFAGGEAVVCEPPQERSGLPARLFENRREGRFGYSIPLSSGDHELRLYFAETEPVQRRDFRIEANGRTLLDHLDVAGDAGGRGLAVVKVFSGLRAADDGLLHLEFRGTNAMLHALEVLPARSLEERSIRILAGQTSGYHDSAGRFWSGDMFYRGGTTVTRTQRVRSTPEPNLYRGERYGRFQYAIPAAAGVYTLRMHFAETWYGSENAQPGGRGSRVFDVVCNGRPLVRSFDIFAEADGENRAVVRTFRGVATNSCGRVVLEFIPRANNGCINAIELIPEGPSEPPGALE